MLVQDDSLPKANIYSSKVLFEQVDLRNKKRMAQMLKRKTALSTKNKPIEQNIQNYPKTTLNSPKNEDKINGLLFINVIRDKENITNNTLSPKNNQIIIDIKIDNELDKDKEAEEEKEINKQNFNNKIKLDNLSAVSNIINENNNYYNNSSTNNSNNNSVLLKDSQEKEINISNLENDSIDDIILNKEDEDSPHKIRTNNLFDYDKDDENNNIINKEENKIKEENEYALKYLSSSSDSFVQLDNNLVARARAQGGDMTDSYLQALFPLINLDNNKSLKNKNYEVTDIIKEEKEFDTPLRLKNNNSKNSKDLKNDSGNGSRGSIDINLNLSGINSNSDSFHKFVKNSPNKKIITNYQLYKKKTNNKSKIKIKKKNNNTKDSKYKGNLSLRTSSKILKKNNTMSKITLNKKCKKNKCLNTSSSSSNINKCKKNINNTSIFYSSFSYNLYTKTKTDNKVDKNQKKVNLKKSLNNLLIKNEKELNDSLISNYINNINKPKGIKIKKINSHYIKNINNYQKYKNLNNHINKNIIKRNIAEYNINKLNIDSINNINSLSSTKRSFFLKDKYSTNYNSIDITKRKNILSSRNISKKFLDNISSRPNKLNNITNTNKNKDTYHKLKNINKTKLNHHQTSSLIYSSKNSFKKNPKLHNNSININISKYNLIKSFSKQNIKKSEINTYLNQEHQLKRSKTQKKITKTNMHNESIILNSTFENHKNKNMNNTYNTLVKKRKFTNVYKKIDYSYVKPKVETGLSEIMLKKLLNNKKLSRKQTNKKIETEKKQSLIKRCKLTMNKTIENFKAMASSIKKKLFKEGNKDKNNNKNEDDIEIKSSGIYSSKNFKKI